MLRLGHYVASLSTGAFTCAERFYMAEAKHEPEFN